MMFFRKTPFAALLPPQNHRCLLVADDCTPTPGLCRLLEEKCRQGPCEMHVVVPRQRKTVLMADPAVSSSRSGDKEIKVSEERYDVAEAMLDSFMRALGDLGQPVTGEIQGGNLLRHVRRMLKIDHWDEVVVLTGGRRVGLFGRDLVSGIERSSRVPVTAVAADLAA